MTDRRRLADLAMGRDVADLLLTNGRLLNVLTGELSVADIAIFGDHIAAVRRGPAEGEWRGIQTFNLRGRIVLPGFIDGGANLEASHLGLTNYGQLALVDGTTTAVFDFAGLASILGMAGLFALSEEAQYLPLDVFSTIPLWAAGPWESPVVHFDQVDPMLLSLPRIVARGGSLTFGELWHGNDSALAWPFPDQPLPIIVNAPGMTLGQIDALAALGVAADRGWRSVAEAMAKLEAGLWLLAGRGPCDAPLADLQPLTKTDAWQRCCLTTGARSASELLQHGHITAVLRDAVAAGIPPSHAVRMVTAAPASLFGFADRGAVLPGRIADLVVVEDLREFDVTMVVKSGELVVWRGEQLHQSAVSAPSLPGGVPFQTPKLDRKLLAVRGHPGSVRVLDLAPDGQTMLADLDLPCQKRQLLVDAEQDVCKVAVVDRHSTSGRCGVAFVRGLGLRSGALCCSFAGAAQQLIVAGVDDESMLAALDSVIADEGGIAVADGGFVRASVPLPIAGLLSASSAEELAADWDVVEQAAAALGCTLPEPFQLLAALASIELGQFRITERGLCDVGQRRLLPVQESEFSQVGA